MEWISIVIGTGGLVGVITAILTYRTNKNERRIQWYDRAINEIERLEDKLEECRESNRKYREKYMHERRKRDILNQRRDENV